MAMREYMDDLFWYPLMFMFWSGLRTTSECLRLTWGMVDREHRLIHVPGTKTASSERTVPYVEGSALDHLIEDQRARCASLLHRLPHADDAVWLKLNGKPIKTLRGSWDKARDRIGKPRIRLHDLRHAFVREASSAGIVTAQGQKISGNATSHVWESYDDSGVREARTSMARIAARQQAIMEEWRDQSDEQKVVNI